MATTYPYKSGHCNSGSHAPEGRCRGEYAGAKCQCVCHLPPHCGGCNCNESGGTK